MGIETKLTPTGGSF